MASATITHHGNLDVVEQQGNASYEYRTEDDGTKFKLKRETRIFLVKDETARGFWESGQGSNLGLELRSGRLEKQDAGWCLVTFEYDNEDDEDSQGEDQSGDKEPLRSVNCTQTQIEIPMQCSPRYMDKNGEPLIPESDREYIRLWLSGTNTEQLTRQKVKALVTSPAGRDLLKRLEIGLTHFQFTQTTVKIAFKRARDGSKYPIGTILETPGDYKWVDQKQTDRVNFKLIARDQQWDGKKHTATEEWVSSGPNGWKADDAIIGMPSTSKTNGIGDPHNEKQQPSK